MEHTGRIISAAFEKKIKSVQDDTIIFFAELEDGQLVRLEDTGPKSYLCKQYNIFTGDTGRDDFRNLVGRNAAIRSNGTIYSLLKLI